MTVGGLALVSGGGTRGLGLGGLAAIGGESMTGIQIGGLAAVSGQGMTGIQTGGLAAVAGERAEGVQIGGLSVVSGTDMRGIQVGGLVAVGGGAMDGLQIGGLATVAGATALGVHVGGLATAAGGDLEGVHIGGIGVVPGCRIRWVQASLGIVEVRHDLSSRVGREGSSDMADCARSEITGLSVAGYRVRGETLKGLTAAVGWIDAEEIRGLAAGGFQRSRLQVGLSVGLVNWTDTLRGVRLGLLNRAGNNPPPFRVLPLLNLNFSD